jgi:NitT/TauT family transport system permease protein
MSSEEHIDPATIGRTQAGPRRSRLSALTRFSDAGLGVVLFVALIGALEVVVRVFDIPSYVFPAPSAILMALYAGFAQSIFSRAAYYLHIATTASEALAAFAIGSALGVAVGALIVQFPLLRRIVLPYFVGLQSVPKVALAPLFVVWFGLGMSSKIVLGVLLTFFPLMINTAAGLSSVERERIELMQSLKATGWKTFRLVTLPSALPFIFAGLEMAAAYSVLGAVVGEFVGGTSGLGVLILNRNAALDIAGSLAALVILAVMGIMLQRAVAFVRARVLFWAPSEDALRFEQGEDG